MMNLINTNGLLNLQFPFLPGSVVNESELVVMILEHYEELVESDVNSSKYSWYSSCSSPIPNVYGFYEDEGLVEWIQDMASLDYFGTVLRYASIEDDDEDTWDSFYELESEYASAYHSDIYNVLSFYNMSFALDEYDVKLGDIINCPLVQVW